MKRRIVTMVLEQLPTESDAEFEDMSYKDVLLFGALLTDQTEAIDEEDDK